MDTRTVQIGEKTYTVKEQSMRTLLPLLEGEAERVGVELMKKAVYNGGGEPLGEAVLDLGFRDFRKLMDVTNELHGLGEDSEGKN